jgi:hypothetical protein
MRPGAAPPRPVDAAPPPLDQWSRPLRRMPGAHLESPMPMSSRSVRPAGNRHSCGDTPLMPRAGNASYLPGMQRAAAWRSRAVVRRSSPLEAASPLGTPSADGARNVRTSVRPALPTGNVSATPCRGAQRSLFRALRQERVIFRAPPRHLPARPCPAPAAAARRTRRRRLDRASRPAARLAVALVAIHAVPETDLVRLQAANLDLASATLTIRRGLQRQVIYLDEVTAALASRWLRYRHQRWPGSRNPHLLVNQQTAADTGPVGATMIQAIFELLGVRPAAAGPHPGWCPPRRRPGALGPRLRHHREHRHRLRPRRSPGIAVSHSEVTAQIRVPARRSPARSVTAARRRSR